MSAQKKTDDFLKEYDLRSTGCRRDVLSLFISEPYALSQAFFEENLHHQYDRVTIYRTLKSFLDAGFIHKVLDDTGGSKYALCSEDCTREHHRDGHVHFKCKQCGKTICMEKISIPAFHFPGSYQAEEINVLVTGICDQCGYESGK
ncbi:MAG: transcriptional repressor [Cyclobacteriaceae bacterium]|nr:transcriptional repressor [Cyclobacteriaceae bacterium]